MVFSIEERKDRQREASKRWRDHNLDESRRRGREYNRTRDHSAIYRRKLERDPQHVKRNNLWASHKLRISQWEELVARANGRCEICQTEFMDGVLPYLDHDHQCCAGKNSCGTCIRGVLCNTCNRALGFFKDDLQTLQAAVRYLEMEKRDVPTVRN